MSIPVKTLLLRPVTIPASSALMDQEHAGGQNRIDTGAGLPGSPG